MVIFKYNFFNSYFLINVNMLLINFNLIYFSRNLNTIPSDDLKSFSLMADFILIHENVV